jgi:formylglycine-generating enzyme required for sulfatase activity
MDDSSEFPLQPPSQAPAYLPRIRNYPGAPEEEPGSDADENPASKPKPKGKAQKPVEDEKKPKSKPTPKKPQEKGDAERPKEKKGVLVEQTPDFDTVDTRRKMRIVVGGVVVGVVVLALFITAQALSPPREAPEGDVPGGTAIAAPPSPEAKAAHAEAEARMLFKDAREFAKNGDTKNATRLLTKIVEAFPQTAGAKDAQEALERPKKNLPLFSDAPTVSAQAAEPPPAPPGPDKPAEVVAVPPTPPNPPGSATVTLTPPLTPPEPYRATGLPREDAKITAKALPPGFRIREEAGVHASGWPWEITCDKDGAAMVLIPGGEFTQGRDDGPANERPAHHVNMPPYYIDQHETTNEQYLLFTKDAGKKISPSVNVAPAKRTYPVTNISAREAREYVQWAGKELPSEAQWEMAARTTDGRKYPWGNAETIEKARDLKSVGPVMQFSNDLSPYGVFDLAGNAWELTNDIFDPTYYQHIKHTTPNNPAGPAKSRARLPAAVVKGGAKDWSVSWRDGMKLDGKTPVLGFRGVLSIEKPAASAGPAAGGGPAAPQKGGGAGVPF